ncbi:MAG: penicillin acylase family protein [Saprospiraceae bacterium]|nr:penicillin acylase family protein [Saprospiraceae bacterium]
MKSLLTLSCITISLLFCLPHFIQAQYLNDFPKINPDNISIVRDTWGVPHIYGKTDQEAAYGLAWAQAEDNFPIVQESLLAVQGKLGQVKGKSGVIMDIFAFLAEVDDVVDVHYQSAFSEQFKKVLNGYVQGINRYAKLHPEEVLVKGSFPINEGHIIKGYVLALTLMTNVPYDLGRIFKDKTLIPEGGALARGSNGFAVSPNRSDNGHSFLAINSHQPLKGAYAWSEAHVNSEEGWNTLGGVLPGGVTIFLGSNPNLAWAHTVNYPDLCDVYQLKMHPKKKNHYSFDGEWIALEPKICKIKVKLGALRIPIRRKFYKSKYGITIKNKKGNYFAVRFPANKKIHAAEQWYHMNKAKNLTEFKAAQALQGIAGLNTVYADKEHNIYMLANGLFPKRNPNYNWKMVLPGDTSATLWEDTYFYPMDSLLQIENPKAGFLYNANGTPFDCTAPEENPNYDLYNPTIGYLNPEEKTTRSLRFQELLAKYPKVSYEDFKTIKFDQKFPKKLFTRTLSNLEYMMNLDPEMHPKIADVIEVLNKWDQNCDVHSKQAAIMSIAIQYILDYQKKGQQAEISGALPEEVYIEALLEAKKHLKKHFAGNLEIELGDLQKHVRGDKVLPIGGMPEVIAQMYTTKYKKGRYESLLGDSYVQLVQFDTEGQISIESIHCYGASNRPESPHFSDQMEMFLKNELKPMTLDKETIFKEAKEVYSPK